MNSNDRHNKIESINKIIKDVYKDIRNDTIGKRSEDIINDILNNQNDTELEETYARFIKIRNTVSKLNMSGVKIDLVLSIRVDKKELLTEIQKVVAVDKVNKDLIFDCRSIENGNVLVVNNMFNGFGLKVDIRGLNLDIQDIEVLDNIVMTINDTINYYAGRVLIYDEDTLDRIVDKFNSVPKDYFSNENELEESNQWVYIFGSLTTLIEAKELLKFGSVCECTKNLIEVMDDIYNEILENDMSLSEIGVDGWNKLFSLVKEWASIKTNELDIDKINSYTNKINKFLESGFEQQVQDALDKKVEEILGYDPY
jgi:hypothetical protein